jgi:hypothetical protein
MAMADYPATNHSRIVGFGAHPTIHLDIDEVGLFGVDRRVRRRHP